MSCRLQQTRWVPGNRRRPAPSDAHPVPRPAAVTTRGAARSEAAPVVPLRAPLGPADARLPVALLAFGVVAGASRFTEHSEPAPPAPRSQSSAALVRALAPLLPIAPEWTLLL